MFSVVLRFLSVRDVPPPSLKPLLPLALPFPFPLPVPLTLPLVGVIVVGDMGIGPAGIAGIEIMLVEDG